MGGDTTFAVALRHSVAAEFARRHMSEIALKAIREEQKEAEKVLVKFVDDYLLDKKKQGWQVAVSLTDAVKKKITDQIDAQISTLIDGLLANMKLRINEAVRDAAARIPALVAERVTKTFDAEVNKAITARLAELRQLLPTSEEGRKITVP